MFDAYVEGYGGFGKSFDFRLLGNIDSERTILAGGLTLKILGAPLQIMRLMRLTSAAERKLTG